jgi:hypothetical protein
MGPGALLAYVPDGLLSDRLVDEGEVLTLLETRETLTLESGRVLPVDEVFVVVAPPVAAVEVGASRHDLALRIGPYLLTAELLTRPGFDPIRSLTRPTGTFLPLGRARVSAAEPGFDELDHPHVCQWHYPARGDPRPSAAAQR